MKINSTVSLDRGYIHYSFDTVKNEHHVGIWDPRVGKFQQADHRLPGEIINHLAPYRYIPEVQELVSWLGR